MIGSLPHKTKQFFFLLIKLSIVFGATYFIYKKLASNEYLDFDVFVSFLLKNNVFSLKNIVFLLFLSAFNWFFEILKWRNLVSSIKNISFFDALKQSLSALTASLFTPNRIGDYAAKVAYYKKPLRKRILLLNLLSNMAQMTITVLFGCIGFFLFTKKYDVDISYIRATRFIIIVIVIGFFTLFGVKQKKYKIRGFNMSKIVDFVKTLPTKVHLNTIGFSLIRYIIFSFQFYYLLTLFGVDVYYSNAMIVITSMYLLASIIPTLSIFDIVVKGSVALYFFDIVGVNNLTVLSIIMLMWILNFVLPALIGSFFVLKAKAHKSVIS